MPELRASDVAIVVATLLGPILAVQAQKWVEWIRHRRDRKAYIFRTLMATRAARVSPEHVQALNMIDFEFYGGGCKEAKVREAWNEYRDHLNTQYSNDTFALWATKGDELFVELLYQMSRCVNFRFERTHIKKSAYSPIAHGNLENDHNLIRTGLVSLFTKKFAIPILTMPATKDESDSESNL